MELINDTNRRYQINFHGTGSEYFGIFIVNALLTFITLGFYYPWARAKQLKYLYGVTAVDDNRFSFHGSGKDMFFGLLKLYLFIAIFLLIYFVSRFLIGSVVLGVILMYVGFIAIIPFVIHGTLRYRLSMTTLKGIRFGYRGDRTRLVVDFIKCFLLTIVTLGIYGSWMEIKLRTYIIKHIRYGDVEGDYEGDGMEFLLLNIKGWLLTLITLGVYAYWWQKDIYAYYIDNTSFHKNEQNLKMKISITGLGLLKLQLVNLLIIIFTLGIGYAWVEIRTMRYMTQNIFLEGDIDLDTVSQTEEDYSDATGHSAFDLLDMDLF